MNLASRMFTMECDVGVTFPDKVEIEGGLLSHNLLENNVESFILATGTI